MNPDLSFSEALVHMKNGVRMSAKFMPANIYIELQTADAYSMNTEPYLKMVTVAHPSPESTTQFEAHIAKCEPWEPGRRSLFSDEWYTSEWQGYEFKKAS